MAEGIAFGYDSTEYSRSVANKNGQVSVNVRIERFLKPEEADRIERGITDLLDMIGGIVKNQ